MSWENAYRDLQDALARARAGCGSEIWVAAGTYKPTQNPSDTAATFQLVNGVPVYGGFSGNETSRNQRNWLTNQTILTGDINNDRTGDAVCVVTASNDVGPATIIDGFTIIKGSQVGIYCNGGSPTIAHNTIKENYYDGIYCDGASPIITQNTIEQNNNLWGIDCRNNSSPDIKACWIQDNATGGIGCDNSNPNITDCLITRNGNESGDGGGIYNDSSSPTVTNCVFRENRARYGGGIYNQYYSSPRVTNCTFRGNTADYYGGGMNNEDNSSPVATNCIFWGNEAADGNEIYNTYSSNPTVSYCDIQGETVYPGTANINTDPLFYDANDPNSYHLTGNSPCIDKGNNSAVPPSVLTDIDGEARVKDGDSDGNKIVDIGADEYYLSPADFNDDLTVNFFDYALFANVWQSNDPGFSLDGDNDVDYNDLVLFCEDWLWQAGWTKTFTCGAGKGMSQTMTAGFAPIKTSSQSILAEQQIEQVEPLKIEQLIKWLEELWLDEETQKLIDEDVWLKFMESLKEEQ
jgi:parallel beta-helix repeat protein